MPRKPKTAVLPPVEKTKFVCHCCGKSKSETEFLQVNGARFGMIPTKSIVL